MTELSLQILRQAQERKPARLSLTDCRVMGSAMLLERAAQRKRMAPTLKQLISGLPGLEVTGKVSVEIHSLVTDSRRVAPGSLFFALPGIRTDGHEFIDEAVDRGAVAIVCGTDCWVPPHITRIQADELRPVVAEIASRFYGQPQTSLSLTGFLGTSGKTVTATILRQFHSSREKVGLLGTIHYAVGDRTLPAHRTTPEPVELFALLSQIQSQGCARALLEVSSHGIDQGRVDGLQFENLVMLNLTPEHLNYHGTLENYVELEQDYVLSQEPGLKHFIAGIDDPAVRKFVDSAPSSLKEKTISFGCSSDADVRAEDVVYTERDTRFTLHWPGGSIKLVSPLLGAFNLQNSLAALASGCADGLDPLEMGTALFDFEGVRGRMERIDMEQPFNLLVDYMHTEASYEKGLDMVRELTEGRLITVFGCGGNRDASTRPVITRLVSEKSDIAVATSDNPRSERLESIFDDMREGNGDCTNVDFIDDRRAAIARAIELANPGDTILIAGKGHETFQEYGDCVVPFDDRAVAREILSNRQWRTQ